jgi:hypothetical protein
MVHTILRSLQLGPLPPIGAAACSLSDEPTISTRHGASALASFCGVARRPSRCVRISINCEARRGRPALREEAVRDASAPLWNSRL